MTKHVQVSASPTDGQVLVWSTALGLWVPSAPTGNAQLAYAEMNDATGASQQNIPTGGAAVDVNGCSIVVPVSARPVYLHGYLTMYAITGYGTANTSINVSLTEVSNGVDTPITIAGLMPASSAAVTTVSVPATRLAASTLRVRTFKLQVVLSTGMTATINNGYFGLRSVIAAEAR